MSSQRFNFRPISRIGQLINIPGWASWNVPKYYNTVIGIERYFLSIRDSAHWECFFIASIWLTHTFDLKNLIYVEGCEIPHCRIVQFQTDDEVSFLCWNWQWTIAPRGFRCSSRSRVQLGCWRSWTWEPGAQGRCWHLPECVHWLPSSPREDNEFFTICFLFCISYDEAMSVFTDIWLSFIPLSIVFSLNKYSKSWL